MPVKAAVAAAVAAGAVVGGAWYAWSLVSGKVWEAADVAASEPQDA